MAKNIVFVYNADSGMFNTLADIAHKVFSPQTYECNLCAISHSYLSERSEWKDFIRSVKADCEFLHRDEFVEKYDFKNPVFPSVYVNEGGVLALCLDADSINECDSMDSLKDKIKSECLV